MPWYCHRNARREEKRKEEKRIRKQFCFFSDEKNKIVLRHVTEWFEIIQAFKAQIYSPGYSCPPIKALKY